MRGQAVRKITNTEELEARRKRREKIQGWTFLIFMVAVIGLLAWLISNSPPPPLEDHPMWMM